MKGSSSLLQFLSLLLAVVYVASFSGSKLNLFLYSFLGLPFTVNETTGDIKTTGKLDRETNSTFTLVIIVRIQY